jgi:hypothetical protein
VTTLGSTFPAFPGCIKQLNCFFFLKLNFNYTSLAYSLLFLPSHILSPSLFTMAKDTMKALVFKGTLKVEIEDRPIPKIVDPTDIVIKVKYSALCGR